MVEKTFALWDKNEYDYDNGTPQQPCVYSHIHMDCKKHPAMLVVPGGAYNHLSEREGLPVALRFYDMGYQAFLLKYTIDETVNTPLWYQPLKDIARAVRFIRSEADRFMAYDDEIYVCGFSAGGNLCASLCVHYDELEDRVFPSVSARPDAAVLCYPVISSGRFAHEDTFRALIGDYLPLDGLRYFSAERHVSADTPPAFVWSMLADESVPWQNAQMYAEALLRFRTPAALHIFNSGRHGIALGEDKYTGKLVKEVAVWPQMAHLFLESLHSTETINKTAQQIGNI